MVTSVINVSKGKDGSGYEYKEFSGLSSDQKPTEGVFNGSTFFEMDTGDAYMFDGDSSSWIKL